ncbi:MAG: Zn-ribbon domain-containing OB-fold protein [Acidimicrobiia bacterium]
MAIKRADFPLPDIEDPLTAEYFAAAARGELAIPRCAGCDRWVWYPEPTCPTCGGALQWRATSGTGRLFSWAVVRRPFLPAFAEMIPFVTALVALEEAPEVRIVSYVVDVEPDALSDGLPLVATYRELAFPTVPGRSVVVPMFAPRT